MSGSLQSHNTDSQFHARFAQALTWSEADSRALIKPIGGGDQQRRFNIYRNNRMVSLIDSLRSTYPALNRLLGEEFFKASARAYIDAHPPEQPVMSEYGAEFGLFLSLLPSTDSVPYLRDVAELEWCQLQAYHCKDAPVFKVTDLSNLAPEVIMNTRFDCHPALHIVESAWPIGSIWTCSINEVQPDEQPIDMNQSEAVLVTRPELQVQVNILNKAVIAFLQSIQQGETLGDAADKALESDPMFDVGENFTGLIGLGAFS